MSLDASINNVGEYYSSHYLAGPFSNDVKSLIAQWREQGSESVPSRIRQLSSLYFRAKAQALEEDAPENRFNAGGDLAAWHSHLLESLGYTQRNAADIPVEGGKAFFPAVARIKRYNQPWLVVCETFFCLPSASLKEGMPSEDPLGTAPFAGRLCDPEKTLCRGDWERLVGRVFTEENSPRWIVFLAGSLVLLLDRHTFAQGRYLSFDFDELYGRNQKSAFDHVAAFLSAETLCPDGESDKVIHDTIEEQSHRFAHGVTDNLQAAVREAIVELVNEWVEDRRRKKLSYTRRTDEIAPRDPASNGNGDRKISAEDLKHEALVFVYRLLFCFYAEARAGELDILPIGDDIYRLGYSLESLRDLEQTPLTPATEQGLYFHEHLKILFNIIHQGFNPKRDHREKQADSPRDEADPGKPEQLDMYDLPETDLEGYRHKTFAIRPLTATLFDPSATPLLNSARLSNRCLQKVVRKLSLSRDEKNRSIGRVNYAELGINQLGAVYEGLLSYKGMFAKEDLIQVKAPKGDFKDKKTPTWFVPYSRLEDFRDEKRKNVVERLADGKPRVYKEGTFILRLSGIDREQSASYYTPEVLTKCLVEEALRELLKDYAPEDADKVLELKICEPAMGSGAFLNEAAEQLAGRYLELKQKQLGTNIEPGRYLDELRRAKHFIATRNVYGVDLNATAVELGALSLWLGSIHRLLVREGKDGEPDRHRTGAPPWFGLRLRCGSSLIGARRAVWTDKQLRGKKHAGAKNPPPRLLKPKEKRKKNEIYHFLVFDEDMLPVHKDQLMRKFYPDQCDAAKKWVEKEARSKWDQEEIADALRICDLVDRHWEQYFREREEALKKTQCTASVWPAPSNSFDASKNGPSLQSQEMTRAMLESESGSFQRLKTVMDAWCALWFWPVEKMDQAPGRATFLAAARLLAGDKPPAEELRPLLSANLGFEIDAVIGATGDDAFDGDLLADLLPWVAETRNIARQQPFHHWELVFSKIMGPEASRPGFDLVLGNPPWIKASWKDAAVLAEIEPMLGVKEGRSADYNRKRPELLQDREALQYYREVHCENSGASTFLNAKRLYPELAGVQTNLYKNFIVRAWGLTGESGIVGLLHPEGPYDDAKGGMLRADLYRRLRGHYQFSNEMKIFNDIDHHTRFSINIYGGYQKRACFRNVSNLFLPHTLQESFNHDKPSDPLPGIKSSQGQWETRPHTFRVVRITEKELGLYAQLLEESGVPPEQTRLPQIHAQPINRVIEKLAKAPLRLMDLEGDYYSTVMFDETYSQRDGILTRQDNPSFQPESADE